MAVEYVKRIRNGHRVKTLVNVSPPLWFERLRRFDPSGFGRRDVFAFPAKRIANALDKRVESRGVTTKKVPSSHPCVPGLEHVAKDFIFCLAGFAVTLELGARVFADASQRLADFA